MNKKKHRGADFRDFLEEEGILEEVETRALKRAIAIKLAQLIEQQSLSKGDMALRMKTSRAAVNRMLDGSNPSILIGSRRSFPLDLQFPPVPDVAVKHNLFVRLDGGVVENDGDVRFDGNARVVTAREGVLQNVAHAPLALAGIL
jgi:antitoxin HicB